MPETVLKPTSAAAATAAPAALPIEKPIAKPKPAKGGWWWGVGRRKTAVARVRLKPASGESGKVQIHAVTRKSGATFKAINEYFAEDRDRTDAIAALKATGMLGRVDVFVRLNGGGFMGQAQAMKLALARALKDFDPNVEATLRQHGMLTRDARDVERKKYGQAGARRRLQFSKR
ncbi:MAG: 30S ribosomal protein S9 [Phycisphaerales bacterium]